MIVQSIRITVLLQLITFFYLKTLLTGTAKVALNSLELTSGNYDKAVAILKSRFGDPQVVIQSNIDILLALHPVSSSPFTDLRRLQLSRNMPKRNWEISKSLDEFEKELLSRELINILNSDNPNSDPPFFSGSTLHLQTQKG